MKYFIICSCEFKESLKTQLRHPTRYTHPLGFPNHVRCSEILSKMLFILSFYFNNFFFVQSCQL